VKRNGTDCVTEPSIGENISPEARGNDGLTQKTA
jgi:hypothetical protein